LGARVLAFFTRILPRIGPLKTLDFTLPSSTTEDLYIRSVNTTVDAYNAELASLQHGKPLSLPNRDFDTGKSTKPGEYSLADETYAKLVGKLWTRHFDLVTPELQANIVAFYAGFPRIQPDNFSPDQWNKVVSEVDDLRGWSPGQ